MKRQHGKLRILNKNVESWHKWLQQLEEDNKSLEIFLIQSVYIESLLKHYADIQFDLFTGGFNGDKNNLMSALRGRIRRYQMGDLIHFLEQCKVINSAEAGLMKNYKEKRNAIIHNLFAEVSEHGFEEELKATIKIGETIISIRKFSILNKFLAPKEAIILKLSIAPREEEMLRFFLAGLTYETIGKKYSISRERVRQILEKVGQKINESKFGHVGPIPVPAPHYTGTPSTENIKEAEEIISATARDFKVLPGDIIGKSRRKEFVVPRHVVYFLLKERLGLSFPKIGKILNRDHTTIIHGYQKMKRLSVSE